LGNLPHDKIKRKFGGDTMMTGQQASIDFIRDYPYKYPPAFCEIAASE